MQSSKATDVEYVGDVMDSFRYRNYLGRVTAEEGQRKVIMQSDTHFGGDKNPCAEIELPARDSMRDFQAIGRAGREIKHPMVKLIEMPIDAEMQAEIEKLREMFKKNIDSSTAQWRMPIIGDDGGHPKCECGKDKHGFAFHMRFCPKWEPIC